MKDEYDFSTINPGSIASAKGKIRITLMLDDDVIEAARECAESAGTGFQTTINHLLRLALAPQTLAIRTTSQVSACAEIKLTQTQDTDSK